MTDNELLLAISNMLTTQLEPIKNDIAALKSDVSDLKQDVSVLKQKVTKIQVDIENDVKPRLQNIESCYTDTYDRYKNGVNQIDAMQADIDLLKKVVQEHSEKLNKTA